MHTYFVVVHHSGMTLKYLQNHPSAERMDVIHLKKGDQLEITNEGFYVYGLGWLILTVINGQTKIFVVYNDLEKHIQQKFILNSADLEIKLSLWRDQIDQSLKERNVEWFKFISRKLTSLKSVG